MTDGYEAVYRQMLGIDETRGDPDDIVPVERLEARARRSTRGRRPAT